MTRAKNIYLVMQALRSARPGRGGAKEMAAEAGISKHSMPVVVDGPAPRAGLPETVTV